MDTISEKAATPEVKGKSLEEQLEYQKRLSHIAKTIHSAIDTELLVPNLQGDILGLFAADRLTLYTVDDSGTEIISTYKSGHEIKEIVVPMNNESVAEYCAQSVKSVNILNAYDEKELRNIHPLLRFDKSWDQRTGYTTTQMLVAPITYNKETLGVIQLVNKKDNPHFTLEDQYAIIDIAGFLQIVLLKDHKSLNTSRGSKFDFLISNNIVSRDGLIEAMARARATGKPVETILIRDCHVSKDDVGKANAAIRFRVDGICQFYKELSASYTKAMVSRIKIMSDLDIAEKRLPQDGKIRLKRFSPLDIELRVATIPTAGQTEDVVLRILASGEPIPLDKMDMNKRDYRVFSEIIQKPYGIVLVVGPTGSGKTTTFHAALAQINTPQTKIWTAEDPVEITQQGLRQVQVKPKIGLDFSTAAMKAFLRADPDVIMVGEMRDHETASTGIEASLTGHLVLSTLHTNSAPETVVRLLDMGMDPFNFSDALLGILAQRLVRTLCASCKQKYHPTRQEYDALARAYEGDFDSLGFPYETDFFIFRPRGCARCGNSGYRGRTGIHELLIGA